MFMKKIRNVSAQRSEMRSNLQSISRSLSNRQKEVIKLLQNKEVLITDERGILITCGDDIKKITLHPFYNLVNKGLVFRQTESPFNYVLSTTGKRIKV
jgi:hypothetical protein